MNNRIVLALSLAGAMILPAYKGTLDRAWVGKDVAQLQIVEQLRKAHGIKAGFGEPRTESQESFFVRYAAENHLPIHPRGAGTGVGLGASRAAMPRMGTDVGIAFQQSLRYFARNVHALRGRRSR
jgi:FAD/FMN-containing dehydrogenase